MAKQLTISKINEMVRFFDDLDANVPTKYKYIADSFSQIIIARGDRVGEIRTYGETVDFLKRIYKNDAMIPTIEEYQANLNQLFGELKEFKFTSKAGYLSHERATSLEKIRWAMAATGREIDMEAVKSMNIYLLLEIFKEANQQVKGASDEFYTLLLNELENNI